ncbi:MAG: helix-turn-helix transcriptional regulator [Clostridia bacterium]|nr:helix-turn-helix transcriptional regulator [Clostridia bacterium]
MLKDYLLLLRKYSELSQADAAESANMKLSKYKSYESGAKNPDEDDCLLLSRMLGFEDDILNDNSSGSISQKLYNLLENNDEQISCDSAYCNGGEPENDTLTEKEIRIILAYRYADEHYKKQFESLTEEVLDKI